jgi:TonB family protein
LKFKEAEYSDEARRSRVQGTCVVSLIVDAQGLPQQVHIVRGIGSGLDEKALDAINHYRFKPGLAKGRPVPVLISVEVSFKLY